MNNQLYTNLNLVCAQSIKDLVAETPCNDLWLLPDVINIVLEYLPTW